MKGNIRSHVGNHSHGGFLHWLGISTLQRSVLKQPVYTFKENVYLINKPWHTLITENTKNTTLCFLIFVPIFLKDAYNSK